jgi:hypothetical protein
MSSMVSYINSNCASAFSGRVWLDVEGSEVSFLSCPVIVILILEALCVLNVAQDTTNNTTSYMCACIVVSSTGRALLPPTKPSTSLSLTPARRTRSSVASTRPRRNGLPSSAPLHIPTAQVRHQDMCRVSSTVPSCSSCHTSQSTTSLFMA